MSRAGPYHLLLTFIYSTLAWNCSSPHLFALPGASYPTAALLAPLRASFPSPAGPNWSYTFSFCAPLQGASVSPRCAGAALAYQVADDGSCFALATQRSDSPLAPLPAPDGQGLFLRLDAGEACGDMQTPRSLVLHLSCSAFAPSSEVLGFSESLLCEYHARVASPAGCVSECPRDAATGEVCGGAVRGACRVHGGAAGCNCAVGLGGRACERNSATTGYDIKRRVSASQLRGLGENLLPGVFFVFGLLLLRTRTPVCLLISRRRRGLLCLAYCSACVLLVGPSLLHRATRSPHVHRTIIAPHSKHESVHAQCDPLAPFSEADVPPVPVPLPRALFGDAAPTPTAGKSDLFLTVVTADHMPEFAANWPSFEDYLLRPFDNHMLLAVPEASAGALLARVLAPLRWVRTDELAPQLREFPCEGAADAVSHPLNGWYRSSKNVTVIVMVRRFRLPPHIARASLEELSRPCGPLMCCTASPGSRPFREDEVAMLTNYSLVNIGYVHHLMVDLAVLDNYEYIFKLDADVRFFYEPRFSPGQFMRERGCAFLHSARVQELVEELKPCRQSAVAATEAFAAHHNRSVASGAYDWCKRPSGYYYGNFIGFWRPFIRAPAQRALSRYLFEHDEKYFTYNDQGSMSAYLCMWYEVDGNAGRGMTDNRHVCNLAEWRVNGYGDPSAGVFAHNN